MNFEPIFQLRNRRLYIRHYVIPLNNGTIRRFRHEEVESEEDKRESNQRPRRAVIHNVTVL